MVLDLTLPTQKIVLPTLKIMWFEWKSEERKKFTNSKTGKQKTEFPSTSHKSGIPSKNSRSRWGLCKAVCLNFIVSMEGLQRNLGPFL